MLLDSDQTQRVLLGGIVEAENVIHSAVGMFNASVKRPQMSSMSDFLFVP